MTDMTWFRNTATGQEFQMAGRFADLLRGTPDITEIDGPGGEAQDEPAPQLRESDLARIPKADLQQMCRDAGVSDEGTKAEMAERLRIAHGDHA